jgi:hypothetical protein
VGWVNDVIWGGIDGNYNTTYDNDWGGGDRSYAPFWKNLFAQLGPSAFQGTGSLNVIKDGYFGHYESYSFNTGNGNGFVSNGVAQTYDGLGVGRNWVREGSVGDFGTTLWQTGIPESKNLSNYESTSESNLRMPDYYSLNVSIAIPNPLTLTFIGWNGNISIDRHGQIYASPIGVSIGKSALLGSASLTANYMLQNNSPSHNETYNFLSGHGVSTGGGFIIGGNYSISPVNSGTKNSIGFGLYTPQVGVSYNYTPDRFIFFKK